MRSYVQQGIVYVVVAVSIFAIYRYSKNQSTEYTNPRGPVIEPEVSLTYHDGSVHTSPLPVATTRRFRNVFYVWCDTRFEFKHYLSVKSVLRFLSPDSVKIYHRRYMHPGADIYNTWLQEIAEKNPLITVHQLSWLYSHHACIGKAKANPSFVDRLTEQREDHLYVNERVLLTTSEIDLSAIVVGDGLLVAGNGSVIRRNSTPDSTENVCATVSQFIVSGGKQACVVAYAGPLFPRDIVELDNSYGRLARTLFYGTSKIRRPQPKYDELIPNIGHMVWLGGGEMDFLFYLSVLSLVFVAKVDAVFIHGEAPPRGTFWNLLKNNRKVQHVFGRGDGEDVVSQSESLRIDIMFKYGGIYVDRDVIFTKPLSHRLRGYDAIATIDIMAWPRFPNAIQGGVLAGKPRTAFWHNMRQSLKTVSSEVFCYRACLLPYLVWERHPDLLLIEPHFQLTCHEGKCQPTWYPHFLVDYVVQSEVYLEHTVDRIDREEVNSLHFTGNYPTELSDYKSLIRANSTMFSDIGKYVLNTSGTLDYFTSSMR